MYNYVVRNFFIDTASPEAILSIWSKINTPNLNRFLIGITTNPKSLSKFFQREFTLEDLAVHLKELNSILVNEIGAINPIIYIQIPSDELTKDYLQKMVDFVRTFDFRSVGIKIPHYTYFLDLSEAFSEEFPDISFNVTGVSDFSVASKVLSYKHIDYVSVIPGRMEENLIDYKPGLSVLNQNRNFYGALKTNRRVIAGSMRTLTQLKDVLAYDCVPTLGETAFDNILQELENTGEKFSDVLSADYTKEIYSYDEFNEANTKLSRDFFTEMNKVNLLKI